jgi:hypothetical protein
MNEIMAHTKKKLPQIKRTFRRAYGFFCFGGFAGVGGVVIAGTEDPLVAAGIFVG